MKTETLYYNGRVFKCVVVGEDAANVFMGSPEGAKYGVLYVDNDSSEVFMADCDDAGTSYNGVDIVRKAA